MVKILEITGKTYQCINTQYTPGEGGQGYVTEIGYMPQYIPGEGGKGHVTELVELRKHEDICI